MTANRAGLAALPHSPGVYIMRAGKGEIIYIGKAIDLARRVSQYFQQSRAGEGGWKIPGLMALLRRIDYLPCQSERDALVLEERLIKEHQPFFNRMLKDGKTYPFVRLNLNEPFPRLSVTREKRRDGARYFGPYPHAAELKGLLRHLWSAGIIPLRPCKWNFSPERPLARKKTDSCVYYHTGQCPAPCAGGISPRQYREIAERAELFLEGRHQELADRFRALMSAASERLDYEQAARYRDFLETLRHMRERIKISRCTGSGLEAKLAKSRAAMRLAETLGLKRPPVHIEAFDNSHLFGEQAVGSMVCFTGGEKNRPHYRRFRIKSALPERGGDDFLMMREIVTRRLAALAKTGEPPPDLLLIDGGPGQLAAAAKAVAASRLRVALVALAKREEELFVPGRGKSIRLDRSDPALRLLMEIRDEAHRFAITYHRRLRDKKLLED
ncbi:MAG: excinuclease ABC subunit UvrC [Elusimicrobiaceae bacterium]|nr:excinuclease ABC subunit UvrC [Elusimicrobiaceae bacterium]